jgi:hypothetical protein
LITISLFGKKDQSKDTPKFHDERSAKAVVRANLRGAKSDREVAEREHKLDQKIRRDADDPRRYAH